MAKAEIKFYRTEITPDKNAHLDNVENYLSTCDSFTIENNYFEHDIDRELKITLEQRYHFGVDGYNYVSIQNDDDGMLVYYFIIGKPKWMSKNSVSLTVSMDTIMTYNEKLEWSNRTHITRRFKDRFVREVLPKVGYVQLVRKIDKEPEGLNPTKFYDNNKTKILDEGLARISDEEARNSKWYLIYKANQSLTTENKEANNPIECYITSDYSFKIQGTTSLSRPSYGAYLVLLNKNNYDTHLTTDNQDLPLFGNTYHGYDIRGWIFYANGNIKFMYYNESSKQYVLQGDTFGSYNYIMSETGFYFSQATQVENIPDVFNFDDTSLTNFMPNRMLTISSINRTDSRYGKIIELPYPPIEFQINDDEEIIVPSDVEMKDGMFLVNNIDTNFYRSIILQDLKELKYGINLSGVRKDNFYSQEMESKLYSSEFYDYFVKYDSFNKQFFLERFNATITGECSYDVSFKPTNTINSNFLFDFTTPNDVYEEIDVSSKYLNVRRSNEVPTFNSSYLDYVRNGYNYDKKNISRNTALQGVGASAQIGTSAITAMVSQKAASAAASSIGAATAITIGVQAIMSIMNIVSNTISQEKNIEQKLQELKNSPASVNGADDIDILNYTTGNKLEVYTNSCSSRVKRSVYELFRLTGYSTDEFSMPYFESRLWYDFIQCEPRFLNEYELKLPKAVIDDIKGRYSLGVTFYHEVDGEYDFDQQYENYERWIYNR